MSEESCSRVSTWPTRCQAESLDKRTVVVWWVKEDWGTRGKWNIIFKTALRKKVK